MKISVEPARSAGLTENSLPLLHEIRHALVKFSETEEPTVIDLKAIPFGPGDEDNLLSFLGVGEVSASVSALGESQIFETLYPGVWLVEHKSADQTRVAFQIEVTDLPAILRTQHEDIQDSIEMLSNKLTTK